MTALSALKRIIRDSSGDALVEAAILFPIMIMIFAALVLLAVYLPTRAVLQRATQFAATAIATEKSDTWLCFDADSMSYKWVTDKRDLDNVYIALFTSGNASAAKGEAIVTEIEGRGVSSKSGELSVESYVFNRLVYKEAVVTASRTFTLPGALDLSFIGFPKEIVVTVTSTAVVQNGDEFVRNVDLAVDFVSFIAGKFNLTGISDGISSAWDKLSGLLGL